MGYFCIILLLMDPFLAILDYTVVNDNVRSSRDSITEVDEINGHVVTRWVQEIHYTILLL